jgi:hypothetical protein
MEEYKFELINRVLESTKNSNKYTFNIEVTAYKFISTNLDLEFQLKLENSILIFKMAKIDLKTNEAWNDLEHIAYLKGYFGFVEKKELEAAVKNLANRIDDLNYASNFNNRWQEFADAFIEWHKIHIKPLLDKEIK